VHRCQIYCQPCSKDTDGTEGTQLKASLCDITPGNVTCSECHSGKPQSAFKDEIFCPHVAYIVDQAYDGAEEADEKKMWFDLLNRPTSGAPDSKLKFDTSIGQWTYPSLSAEIDKEEMLRTGDRVPKMPKRTMQLIKDRLRPSFMGGGGRSRNSFRRISC